MWFIPSQKSLPTCTGVGPKMPGATALTMAHGTTPTAAPGPGSALAISTWPSSVAVATTKTPLRLGGAGGGERLEQGVCRAICGFELSPD